MEKTVSIFRRKNTSLDRAEMHRHLKLWDVIFLGLGSMVGTGIFTITGTGAALYAGPGLVLSIVVAAIAVGISALFYAEFASRIPANGGAYSYTYATLGEFPAWLVAWFIMMEFLAAISGVASGWASYLKGLLESFGLRLPVALSGTFDPSKGHYVDLLPILVMACVLAIVLSNAKSVLRFNSSLVILKFSALALFIIVGLFFLKPANWSNFMPYGLGTIFGGQTGIFGGAAIMFFAFLGFESISMTVDEVETPQKTIPRGIITSLSIVTVLYVVVTLVLTGLVYYTKLNVDDAVAFALRQVHMGWAANYVSVVAILTLITVCISMTYALARTIYSVSRDGLLPQALSQVTSKTKIPKNATILVGILAMICSGVFPLARLAEFVNIVTLAYLVILAIGLLELRRREGEPKVDEFRTPWVPALPLLSIVICLALMSQLQLITWVAFIVVIVIGCLIYFGYGYKHATVKD